MDATSSTMQAKQNAHLPLSPARDGGPLRRLGARGLCYRCVDIAAKKKEKHRGQHRSLKISSQAAFPLYNGVESSRGLPGVGKDRAGRRRMRELGF